MAQSKKKAKSKSKPKAKATKKAAPKAASATRKIILTAQAPQPIGPYSQAVRTGNLLFCSGQIPLDPTTGNPVGGVDVSAQAHQVLQNLKAVLEAGGASLESVIKVTIFLKNMGDFPRVNEVYATYFKAEPPARSTIEVARLPKDALVEIEAIALAK